MAAEVQPEAPFPEFDRAGWFEIAEAREDFEGATSFVDRLAAAIAGSGSFDAEDVVRKKM
jgi:predicted NUDIX family NTP pyrophosphohydrolase